MEFIPTTFEIKEMRVQPLSAPLSGRFRPPPDKDVLRQALFFGPALRTRLRIGGAALEDAGEQAVRALSLLGVSVVPGDNGLSLNYDGEGINRLNFDCDVDASLAAALTGVCLGQQVHAELQVRDAEPQLNELRQLEPAFPGRLVADGGTLRVLPGDAGIGCQLVITGEHALNTAVLALSAARSDAAFELDQNCPDHALRLARHYGAEVSRREGKLMLNCSSLRAADVKIPGSPVWASSLILCAMLQSGSNLLLEEVSSNPITAAILRVFSDGSTSIKRERSYQLGYEPAADIRVHGGGRIGPVNINANRALRMEPYLPHLLVLASRAHGASMFRGFDSPLSLSAHLRGSQLGLPGLAAQLLRSFGADVEDIEGGWRMHGQPRLFGGEAFCMGDPLLTRTAMLCAAVAEGPSVLYAPAQLRDEPLVGLLSA